METDRELFAREQQEVDRLRDTRPPPVSRWNETRGNQWASSD